MENENYAIGTAELPALDGLRCFLESAQCLSFRGAGRALGLTPAAVGQRVRQLEDQLGRRLFERTTRRMALTEAGRSLLPQARQALMSAASVLRQGRGELGPGPVTLTMGTRHELGMSWILPMLPRLRREHPGLTVHLYFGSGEDLLIRVRTREIDCAVGSMRLTDPELAAAQLHREDYVFVGAPSLLRRLPLDRPEDALQHTLIDTHPELPLYAYLRDAPGGADRFRFSGILKMGTIAAIRDLVLAAEGVAILPEYLVRRDLEARRLRRILPRVRLAHDHFRLVFRSRDPRTSLYRELARTMHGVPLR